MRSAYPCIYKIAMNIEPVNSTSLAEHLQLEEPEYWETRIRLRHPERKPRMAKLAKAMEAIAVDVDACWYPQQIAC